MVMMFLKGVGLWVKLRFRVQAQDPEIARGIPMEGLNCLNHLLEPYGPQRVHVPK